MSSLGTETHRKAAPQRGEIWPNTGMTGPDFFTHRTVVYIKIKILFTPGVLVYVHSEWGAEAEWSADTVSKQHLSPTHPQSENFIIS